MDTEKVLLCDFRESAFYSRRRDCPADDWCRDGRCGMVLDGSSSLQLPTYCDIVEITPKIRRTRLLSILAEVELRLLDRRVVTQFQSAID